MVKEKSIKVYMLQCLQKSPRVNSNNMKRQMLSVSVLYWRLITLFNYFEPPNSMLFMYLLIAVLHGKLDLSGFDF